MNTLSDEADTHAVARVVEGNLDENGAAAATLQAFLHYQATDIFCKQTAKNAGQANAEYTVN